MDNVITYARDWGDQPFDALPFNEVDNVAFSQIVHLPFERAFEQYGRKYLSLRELSLALSDMSADRVYEIMLRPRLELLHTMGAGGRFGPLPFYQFVDDISQEDEKQFCAVTTRLPDGTTVIIFRGTDLSLAGWKEDFNMSFESPTPAQRQAVEYVKRAAIQTEDPLILLGHSKGGNLALYAASFCPSDIQGRIRRVYTSDGPGLIPQDAKREGYLAVKNRVVSLLPQNSLVGLLLKQHKPYRVVRCRAIGLLQHDPFRWEVRATAFVGRKRLSYNSRMLDKTLDAWLARMPAHQRKLFADTLYEVVSASEADTLGSLVKNYRRSARAMLAAMRELDPDVRRMVRKTISALFRQGAENIWEDIKALPDKLLRDKG